jgi:hypothetical protein
MVPLLRCDQEPTPMDLREYERIKFRLAEILRALDALKAAAPKDPMGIWLATDALGE